jgi:hypothetical protein
MSSSYNAGYDAEGMLASFKRGDALEFKRIVSNEKRFKHEKYYQPSLLPRKLITKTFSRTSMGSGHGIPADTSLLRLRISFSAHRRTILRGLRLL